jgi:transcriptional regulator with XRE-family HTH domain
MRRKPLSEEIRQAMKESGRTNYDLARAMNVSPSTVWRFVEGKNGLSLPLLDRLAEVLELHVVVGRKEK